MAVVKPKLRERRAELTRGLILDAARGLFRERGYVLTTIEQIAAGAGTGASTVYAAFGTKRELLTQLRWRAVERAEIPGLGLAIPPGAEPDERLRILTGRFRRLYETAGDVFAVQQAALDSDSELAANWEAARRERRAHVEEILKPLSKRLRSDLSLRRAGDIVDGLLEFSLYQELVTRDGWAPAEYERWMAGTLARILLS